MPLSKKLISLIEHGWVPDSITRFGIRRLLKRRLKSISQTDSCARDQHQQQLLKLFSAGPVALVPEKANEQHYEVPAGLFQLMLGPRWKYSCCWWPTGVDSLADAEEAALAETCRRAEIADSMNVLELGCGWGSLTFWLLEQYPHATITAVSNSWSQRDHILKRAHERGVADRLNLVTCDMNDFQTEEEFDRVVSIEMFEHMRNLKLLMARIAAWLKPEGKLFVHIFCHRELAYEFQDNGESDWMARNFFAGGMMPSRQLLSHFQERLVLRNEWTWEGQHYQRTAEAWLAKLDHNREPALKELTEAYGAEHAEVWIQRWRMFYLSCSELFGYRQGSEWFVGHYLFERNKVDR